MISLYTMGEKGLCVLNALVDKKCVIDQVIIGRDKTVAYDFSSDIVKSCEENDLKWHYKTDNYSTRSIYLIAVSWRWMIKTQKDQKLIVFHDSLCRLYVDSIH